MQFPMATVKKNALYLCRYVTYFFAKNHLPKNFFLTLNKFYDISNLNKEELSQDMRKRRNLVELGRTSPFLSAGGGGESDTHLRMCDVI
jgi:hypothetical protein